MKMFITLPDGEELEAHVTEVITQRDRTFFNFVGREVNSGESIEVTVLTPELKREDG